MLLSVRIFNRLLPAFQCALIRAPVFDFIPLLLYLFFIAALRSRCGHYIFALWFLLSSFFLSSPNLSGRRLDVYHTYTHGVALVRI